MLGFGHLCQPGLVPLALLMLLVATGAATAQGAPKPKLPDGFKLNLLIRGTIIAVNQANQTGNYTVLRGLASPSFQRAHSSEKLSRAFADLRNRKIDMAALVNFTPEFVRKPHLDKNGRLRLTGFVPTQPQQVNFDMLFEKHRKRWRLFAISMKVSAPKTAALAR